MVESGFQAGSRVGSTKRDHGRTFVEINWADPVTGRDRPILMRDGCYDAGSPNNWQKFSQEQLETMASGKSVKLNYTTSSGVTREHDFLLWERTSQFGTKSYGPVEKNKAEREIAQAVAERQKVTSAGRDAISAALSESAKFVAGIHDLGPDFGK